MPREAVIERFLVPGGRYLVTRDMDSINLFDLGRVGQKPLETPVLVARQSLQQYFTRTAVALEVVGVKGDESRLRVGLGFWGTFKLGE
jgi:hypothetical protein